MSNIEKYKKAFIDSLSLNNSTELEKLEYQSIAEWDSIGHMTLMSELENIFGISSIVIFISKIFIVTIRSLDTLFL